MKISSYSKGDAIKYLTKSINKKDYVGILMKYGSEGVDALSRATPKDSGVSASSWSYNITNSNGSYKCSWCNSDTSNGTPIVIFIQYGHATVSGGWVEAHPFINEALSSIMQRCSNELKGV